MVALVGTGLLLLDGWLLGRSIGVYYKCILRWNLEVNAAPQSDTSSNSPLPSSVATLPSSAATLAASPSVVSALPG